MGQKLDIYQVDAFTSGSFTGNPAAIIPLNNWLPTDLLQKIAEENNLSETAYVVKEAEGYRIRWFTPATEVKLCGHATLASAFTFYELLGYQEDRLDFNSLSGKLSVSKNGEQFTLDFPLDNIEEADCPTILNESLGVEPSETYLGSTDYLLIYENQKIVSDISPNFSLMAQSPGRGCIISSRGEDYDIVCRGFFPQSGINEDPATGSAQTTLAAYWPKRLNKKTFTTCQLSNRKGFFENTVNHTRVNISGKCNLYLKGEIYI